MQLEDIVLSSYELLIKLPKPKPDNEGKYGIASRNKLKSLPEALREFTDDEDNITHFVKTAAYFLPRAESGSGKAMMPFLELLLEKVKQIRKSEPPGEALKQIQRLIGYTNWNVDAVCAIFTAENSDEQIRKRLHTMLEAELGVINAEKHTGKIVEDIINWKNRS
jgi:hypothetical protein